MFWASDRFGMKHCKFPWRRNPQTWRRTWMVSNCRPWDMRPARHLWFSREVVHNIYTYIYTYVHDIIYFIYVHHTHTHIYNIIVYDMYSTYTHNYSILTDTHTQKNHIHWNICPFVNDFSKKFYACNLWIINVDLRKFFLRLQVQISVPSFPMNSPLALC
jgi:hypothetical protein